MLLQETCRDKGSEMTCRQNALWGENWEFGFLTPENHKNHDLLFSQWMREAVL